MPREYETDLDQEQLNENPEHPKSSKAKMPWDNKFGEDENFKTRQYSRTARNQPIREATTLSKVLLLLIVVSLIVPFALYMYVNANKEETKPRTAQQISVERNATTTTTTTQTTAATTKASESASETTSETTLATTLATTVATTAAPAASGTYTIQAGDNWYRISVNHGVSLSALLAANGATETTPISPGQVINIP